MGRIRQDGERDATDHERMDRSWGGVARKKVKFFVGLSGDEHRTPGAYDVLDGQSASSVARIAKEGSGVWLGI